MSNMRCHVLLRFKEQEWLGDKYIKSTILTIECEFDGLGSPEAVARTTLRAAERFGADIKILGVSVSRS